jgi:hypothetical protein
MGALQRSCRPNLNGPFAQNPILSRPTAEGFAGEHARLFPQSIVSTIDMKRPLEMIATLPSAQIESTPASKLRDWGRTCVVIEGANMPGPTWAVVRARSNAYRPRVALPLLIRLVYFRLTFNLSNE